MVLKARSENMERYNFQTIKKNSENYGANLHKKFEELQLFEENVDYMNVNPEDDVKFAFSQSEHKLKAYLRFQEFDLSDKAVSDILAKSPIGVSKKSFNETWSLRDVNNIPIGTHILNNAVSRSFKEQRHILFGNTVRAVVNPKFPVHTLKINRLFESLRDNLEIRGKEYKADLDFNVESGNVAMQIITDITDLNIEELKVNDTIGFGFSIHNNFYGNRRFSLNASTLNLACLNGMLDTKSIQNLDIVHSSINNFAIKISNWIFKNADRSNLTRGERAILYWMGSGKWVTEDYDLQFYNLFSNTILNVFEEEKERKIFEIKAAAMKSIADVHKELTKLQKRYKLSIKARDEILYTFENDDTIDQNNLNDYYLSMAISRYANNPTLSFTDRENFQIMANDVMSRASLVTI